MQQQAAEKDSTRSEAFLAECRQNNKVEASERMSFVPSTDASATQCIDAKATLPTSFFDSHTEV
jgi:hypothetical protein